MVSVPASSDPQRKAAPAAVRPAGVELEAPVDEPAAAALACGLQVEKAQLLVFDLGGGSFDVSALDAFDTVTGARASGGDHHFGDDDFRESLAGWPPARAGVVEGDLSEGERARLTPAAEWANRALSAAGVRRAGRSRSVVRRTRAA